MKARAMKGKLNYLNSIFLGKKDILLEIVNDMEEKECKWWVHVKKYAEECETRMRSQKMC